MARYTKTCSTSLGDVMAAKEERCPSCGATLIRYLNPFPTVDIVIEQDGCILLIRRKNPPLGWALPGGFIDYGESAEAAAIREAKEETGLDVELKGVLGVYSNPSRDPRHHTLSVVFVAEAHGTPLAGDDAGEVRLFPLSAMPKLAFDHGQIIQDYRDFKGGKRHLAPVQQVPFTE